MDPIERGKENREVDEDVEVLKFITKDQTPLVRTEEDIKESHEEEDLIWGNFKAKDFAIYFAGAGLAALGLGVAVGVPLGLGIDRTEGEGKKKLSSSVVAKKKKVGKAKAAPIFSQDGAMMALKAFSIATVLNVGVAVGVTSAFCWYNNVPITEAGDVISSWSQRWRSGLERSSQGAIQGIRRAGESIGQSTRQSLHSMRGTAFGEWFNSNVRQSTRKRSQVSAEEEIDIQAAEEELRKKEAEMRERKRQQE